jgi:4Fe-4S ferredoxin
MNAAHTNPCKHAAGVLKPRIDHTQCEGKGDCRRVCPEAVFAVRRVTRAEFGQRPLRTQVKLLIHGAKQVFAVSAERCKGCGLCVQACPEGAIALERLPARVDALKSAFAGSA